MDIEPITIIVYGKAHGSVNWELAVVETVGRKTLLTEAAYFDKRSDVARRVARGIASKLIDPNGDDVKSAHRSNLWPCSVMCTLHYQQ